MSEIIDEKVNVWDVIDTYFRDEPYYKSQHQVDSFNEFILSKDNGIQHIIKRENPLHIFKGDAGDGNFKYQILIYYGETLNEEGNPIQGLENIFISSPTIYDGDVDTSKYMYPNEARLKNYTYRSCIFCNIGVKYIMSDGSIEVRNFEKLNIGFIPIMIHSKLCILNKLDSVKLSEMGECPFDQGGYFIIKGKEKVVISQESRINNILYVTNNKGDFEGYIKSVSTKGFQSSRSNYIYYSEQTYRPNINGELTYKKANLLTVRIKGFAHESGKDINIPLFILFRALGFNSEKEILLPEKSEIHNKFHINIFEQSIKNNILSDRNKISINKEGYWRYNNQPPRFISTNIKERPTPTPTPYSKPQTIFKIGSSVKHETFGKGVILDMSFSDYDQKHLAHIKFLGLSSDVWLTDDFIEMDTEVRS